MKLDILVNTIRMLAKEYPQCRILTLCNKRITLVDQDFNEYTFHLDEDGRVLRAKEFVCMN